MRTKAQTMKNNEDSKARHRKKSLEKMTAELIENSIKPIVIPEAWKSSTTNYIINKAYEAIRKQWSDFRLDHRIKDREKYREQQNNINKKRYKTDKDYKKRMLERTSNQYRERKKTIERTTKIEENLHRVIKALEYTQEQKYSSHTHLVLSYLYDIRDGSVPENLITDKISQRVENEVS